MKNFLLKKPFLIGAVHFPPLFGCKGFPGLRVAYEMAKKDALTFQKGGFDAVIFENNYDLPHRERVQPETIVAMKALIERVVKYLHIPHGVSVLWNDYAAALDIAQATRGSFIRVPVFVDRVKTSYGIIRGDAKRIVAERKRQKASSVALLTDVHVKHATILSRKTLVQSIVAATEAGSDGIIITGKWTGDAPEASDLAKAKTTTRLPVFAGSGVDISNIKEVLRFANGVIVSTSLKRGGSKKQEVNVKPWTARIDLRKVRALVAASRR